MIYPRRPRKSVVKIKNIGIIVLAAGASSRMKQPKQLLEFEGETLLRRAALTAVESVCSPVIVVLGANFEDTKKEVEDLDVEICFNKNWQTGLSSSIKKGLKNLQETAPKIDAVIITLADQPFVTANHINSFAEKFHQSKCAIIAAKYNETIGVPALFAKEVFEDFAEIFGDKGAKTILERRRDILKTIDLPEAAFDIDTARDFINLNKLDKNP